MARGATMSRGALDCSLDSGGPLADTLRDHMEVPMDEDTKECPQCGRMLPEGAYVPDERYADLLNPTCRECLRAWDRERSARPEVKAARRKREAERRKADPEWARRESERVQAWRRKQRGAA